MLILKQVVQILVQDCSRLLNIPIMQILQEINFGITEKELICVDLEYSMKLKITCVSSCFILFLK